MSEQQELVARPKTEIENSCQKTLLNVLTRYHKSIEAMLPKLIDPKRFAWLAVTAIRSDPRLAGCTPASFINSVMLATQMGLEIRRDSAYLVAYGTTCQLLIDYKGKVGIARRSGKVGGIQAVTIRERDAFEWKYTIDGVVFKHEPFANGIVSPEERGDIVGVYAFAHLTDGGKQFREPMSLSEIDRIRRRSKAGVSFMTLNQIFEAHKLTEDGSQAIWQTWEYKDKRRQPWVTDFEPMALKTVLHSLFKSLPMDPAGDLSQRVDEGFETGKQPNILADLVDIDPIDEKPMIEASVEEQQKAMEEKLSQVRQDAAAKKAARKATPSPATQPAPPPSQSAANQAPPRQVVKDWEELAQPNLMGYGPGDRAYCRNVLYQVTDAGEWEAVRQ
jgi:recombination protein RecT